MSDAPQYSRVGIPATMTAAHVAAFERHALGWLVLSTEGAVDQMNLKDILKLLRALVDGRRDTFDVRTQMVVDKVLYNRLVGLVEGKAIGTSRYVANEIREIGDVLAGWPTPQEATKQLREEV